MQKLRELPAKNFIAACLAVFSVSFISPAFCANNPTESWTVGRGEANGKPIFVRINMGLKIGEPRFPFRAVYAINFLHPTRDGRPEKDETSKANEIEDQLNSMIAQRDTGKFVAVQTHDGVRKFLFYVQSEKIAHDVEAALKVPKDYKVDMNVTSDPTWMVYNKIRSEHERVHGRK